MTASVHPLCREAIDGMLLQAGLRAVADRAYLFEFAQGRMSNTHEWCRRGVPAFKEALSDLPLSAWPGITAPVQSGASVVANTQDSLTEKEAAEMRAENIHALAVAPVLAGDAVLGFVGLDSCRALRTWTPEDVRALEQVAAQVGRWLLGVVQLRQLALPPAPAPRVAAAHAAAAAFAAKRWAILPPSTWGLAVAEAADYVALCQRAWRTMAPDIAPYTEFRDVGYARYRYYQGTLLPLAHKPFFQVDPTANVLLNSAPRPFNRVPDSVREHPVLLAILRTLLEDVWGGELGDEAHVNVHPVRVRNFHRGEIHKHVHTTREGTHVDSTERVAVILVERRNVAPDGPRTALYRAECPIGLRRDAPADEAQLAPLRVVQHVLRTPLEAITFDDTAFKHDAEDFRPDAGGECSRSVMLVMARRPVQTAAPTDGRAIDGCSPRSSSY